jgi:hypothetical protein
MLARLCLYAALCGVLLSLHLSSAEAANCLISADQKAINVVTDNASSDEKSCNVTCKVETKTGPTNISCGGTTPPLAKDHSLCDFDKPAAYYTKVVSATGTCK